MPINQLTSSSSTSTKKTPIQDRIGKPCGSGVGGVINGGEHTTLQKQINGYYMYNFSQAQNGSKSLILVSNLLYYILPPEKINNGISTKH